MQVPRASLLHERPAREVPSKTPPPVTTMTTRRALTTKEYIALTRATDKVLLPMGMKGVTEIGAQDIPALLHSVTNGAFKFYWSTYLLSRAHDRRV